MAQRWFCTICEETETTSDHCSIIYHRHNGGFTVLTAQNERGAVKEPAVKRTTKPRVNKRKPMSQAEIDTAWQQRQAQIVDGMDLHTIRGTSNDT